MPIVLLSRPKTTQHNTPPVIDGSCVTGVQPMFQVFQQYPGVLESDDAKKIIRSYNKVAKVLLEYEVVYHQAWLKQIDVIKSGLSASLLVRHPDTQVLYVNFDPSILELVREVDCMQRMGQEIPPAARLIKSKKNAIKASYSLLSVSEK